MSNNSNGVISNFLWRFAERFVAQGVSFQVAIVLARIMEPEVYGTIVMITVFSIILNVFINVGLGSALVQVKDADDLDFYCISLQKSGEF